MGTGASVSADSVRERLEADGGTDVELSDAQKAELHALYVSQ